MISVYTVRRAIKKGEIEVLVQDGDILLSDAISGECVKIGSIKECANERGDD